MAENLVIVESPAKAKTIEKFLGKDFLVKSSYGHIRDLSKKDFGIDIGNNYQPIYEISSDKKTIVSELRKLAKEAKQIWLASDEDREGEAIAWHLFEVLKLKTGNTKRIVFHEITKNAITKAIENPREIDINLVNAQQARRVLDRLVGFELSPLLWKKIKPSLSAGRVQSVAVRLLVEREREIMAFKSDSSYRVVADFLVTDAHNKQHQLKAELAVRFATKEEAEAYLQKTVGARFSIADIEKKPGKKTPAPPFTTSTLQQEASRKLGYSVSQTMSIAQRLYESGKITYMRTDSVNLSQEALNQSKSIIEQEYGKEYAKTRQYSNKNKSAQEAHEAIRPTTFEKNASSKAQEQKLYELIWKRTMASQMSDAVLEKTTIKIQNSNQPDKKFVARGELIQFDGFLKVYLEGTDDENEEEQSGILPPLNVGQLIDMQKIEATQKFAHHPPRYTEASLVKKLEELGIGRPSTYAPTISTVLNRGYVVKESREGTTRKYYVVTLQNAKVNTKQKTENTGFEKNKLFPTDIGMVVNDFLVEHFKDVLDYHFTATVEKEFDDIAEGKMKWPKMIDQFYQPFHQKIEVTQETSERSSGERILGTHPQTGHTILVRIGRYGPMAQVGTSAETDQPKYAGLRKGQLLETITLEEALDLFKLPRDLGLYEDKKVVIGIGRFGPYVRHDGKFVSLKKDLDDPLTIELERAVELIEEKRDADRKKLIKAFDDQPELQVLNGRWGPYISYQKKNFKIPKDIEADKLTLEECLKIIKEAPAKKTARKTPAKTTTTKKATTKKTTAKKKK